MKKNFLRNTVFLSIVAVALIVLPALLIKVRVINAYWARIFTLGGVYAILALSVNVVCGITGQLSLGQAGFAAIGAYAVIFLTQKAGLPLFVSVIFAGFIAAFFGFLIGFPVLKLEGDYLAIVTLAFGEIIKVVLLNQKELTGGPNGMQFLSFFTSNLKLGPFAAWVSITGTLVLVVVLLQNFLRSTYGRAIMAVREDEIAANSNGISVFRYKMIGFIIAAFIGGIGGALYAPLVGFVKPDFADFNHSVNYLIYVVLGGMGSTTGSILAAYLLTVIQEYLRFLGNFRQLFYPLILIFVMLFRPQGLLGTKEFSFVKVLEKSFSFLKGKKKEAVQ
ncbi:MAG: branched-chain amino acid ABC transporter permease [Treponema sp.]|nr:branched-chain amino acid ABC transporter permease [Treponema sp.]